MTEKFVEILKSINMKTNFRDYQKIKYLNYLTKTINQS